MKNPSNVGKMLVFLLTMLGAISCTNTAASTQVAPQELLSTVTKSDVRNFWTNDFGREKRNGGFSAIVPIDKAETFVTSIRKQLMPGYVAFVGTTNNLDNPSLKVAEIVVAPGQDQFDIIRLAATDAVNYDMTTDQIIAELKQWDSQVGIDIWQAETDTVQLKLKSLPRDLPSFSRKLYNFCPDIVDQGVGDVESLQASIKQEHAIVLWWD